MMSFWEFLTGPIMDQNRSVPNLIYNLFCGVEIRVDIIYGRKLLWADFVIGQNNPLLAVKPGSV